MSKSLLLLRHGETDGNLHRVVQMSDTPLNASGLQQAASAARRIRAEFGSQLVIRASDYTRAHQTARAVSKLTDVNITLDPLLRERNLGDLRGRAYDDLGFDPFAPDYHPPAGESWDQFFERVASFWATVPQLVEETPAGHALVLVTHGLVLRAIALHHLDSDFVDDSHQIKGSSTEGAPWLNTSLTVLRQTEDERWRLLAFNDASHLTLSTNAEGAIA